MPSKNIINADGFVLVESENYRGAFTLDGGGMLETVNFDNAGCALWDDAGYCDPIRGDDPELQADIEQRLEKIAASLGIPSYELLAYMIGE